MGPAGPGITQLTRLTLLREVTYDPATNDLVANPVPELSTLRSGTIASERKVSLQANAVHHVSKTAGGAAASADIELNFTIPQDGGSFGACVLAKPPGSKPFVPHWEVVPNSNAAYDKVGVPGKAYGGGVGTTSRRLTSSLLLLLLLLLLPPPPPPPPPPPLLLR